MPHAEGQTTIHGVQLHVNDGLLAANEVEQMVSSYPNDSIEDLYNRYITYGYVLIRGLLPREDVLAAREAYFSSMEPSGVIKDGTKPVEGIFNDSASPADYPGIGAGSVRNAPPGSTDRSAIFVNAALKAHTEPWYAGSKDGSVRGFCNHPALKEFVARLTGWGDATLPVRRTLLRNNTPGNRAIGVHYDQSFMRYGEPTALTAWVPIGDVRLQGGGLIYLQGGDKLGQEIEEEFSTKAKAAGMTDEEMRYAFNANMMSTGFLAEGPADFGRMHGKKWLVSDYQAGDVVFHTPHMIHASTINHDPEGRIRLGTDLRFVNSARRWDTRWDKDYEFDDGL
ncbi:hypothetical protein B0J13DRAFT_680363 [Dactylonectria estremocensis]|uniref:Phytanoyl-CoA hydroxylase n=1 Tax=Dactylonectria estremocensis TaxID=1079267 RepID=A0A9P9DM17_9HYPO|nr:hypothetical protein B0J13DRAFT_680363 [Dactylonectria estremocensis]